jgi:hypothetical protein
VDAAWLQSIQKARTKVARYLQKPRRFSRNDMRVLVISQFLVELCPGRTPSETSDDLTAMLSHVEAMATSLLREVQRPSKDVREVPRRSSHEELYLFK